MSITINDGYAWPRQLSRLSLSVLHQAGNIELTLGKLPHYVLGAMKSVRTKSFCVSRATRMREVPFSIRLRVPRGLMTPQCHVYPCRTPLLLDNATCTSHLKYYLHKLCVVFRLFYKIQRKRSCRLHTNSSYRLHGMPGTYR